MVQRMYPLTSTYTFDQRTDSFPQNAMQHIVDFLVQFHVKTLNIFVFNQSVI